MFSYSELDTVGRQVRSCQIVQGYCLRVLAAANACMNQGMNGASFVWLFIAIALATLEE